MGPFTGVIGLNESIRRGGFGLRATRLLMQDFRKQVSGAWVDRVQVFRIAPTSV